MYTSVIIYEFNTPKDDVITKYVSNVGNSDVPYPYAVGKKYVYIMLDKVYLPKNKFDRDNFVQEEIYDVYYDKNFKKISKHFPGFKIVHTRLW